MSALLALSIATAILCGLWTWLAPLLHMIGWAGFAGCTSFFSIGTGDWKAVLKTVICNFVGVICGMSILMLSKYLPFWESAAIFSGVVTFAMCILGKFRWTSFIPGIFMGCFSTFASNGDYLHLVPSMICGALLGIACSKSGDWLHAVCARHKA